MAARNYLDFSDKVVCVTGSTKNIGKAIAELFAEHGAAVVVNGRGKDKVRTVADEFRRKGYRVLECAADVGNRREVESLFRTIENDFGKLDVLVNNAAVIESGTMESSDEASWERVFRANVLGTFYTSKAAIPLMRRGGSGSIINVSSAAAVYGSPRGQDPGASAYLTSKGALISFTRALAHELGSYNIRVNALTPALIDTDAMTQEFRKAAAEIRLPLRRVGSPAEVASVCLFLASDMASFVTGETIALGGTVKANFES